MIIDKKDILINFGKRFKYLRVINNFTQAELAMELGVEVSQISRIERGLINTSILMIIETSKILKIKPSDFFEELL